MKKIWRILIGLVVLVLVVYLLRKVDFKQVWALVKTANPWYLLAAFLAYGLSFLVFNWRFRYALNRLVKSRFWFVMKITIMGFFVGTITPATQMGGDPVRAHFLSKKYKKPRSEMLGVVLVDRLYHGTISFLFIVLSAFFAFTFLPLSSEVKMVLQSGFFLVVFLMIVVVAFAYLQKKFNITELFSKLMPFLRRKKVRKRKPKSKFKQIFFEHFGNFYRTFKEVAVDKKVIITGLGLSIIYWLLNFIVPYLLFLSFGQKVSFFMVMVVFNVGIIISEFAPSPGGVGLIEGATFFVYSLVGISVELALAVTLLTRIIFYFYSLLLGGLSLVDLERTFG